MKSPLVPRVESTLSTHFGYVWTFTFDVGYATIEGRRPFFSPVFSHVEPGARVSHNNLLEEHTCDADSTFRGGNLEPQNTLLIPYCVQRVQSIDFLSLCTFHSPLTPGYLVANTTLSLLQLDGQSVWPRGIHCTRRRPGTGNGLRVRVQHDHWIMERNSGMIRTNVAELTRQPYANFNSSEFCHSRQ